MARKPFETLTEQMYYVLLALSVPRHGYAIMQYITMLTVGRVNVGAGTLYMLLARFEEDGYIRAVEDEKEKGRKVYELKQEGKTLLARERKRYSLLIADYEEVMRGYDV